LIAPVLLKRYTIFSVLKVPAGTVIVSSASTRATFETFVCLPIDGTLRPERLLPRRARGERPHVADPGGTERNTTARSTVSCVKARSVFRKKISRVPVLIT